ncbi:hypothetical protein BJ741DRAFT_630436 [Chytriomyces cf. hyalinus JEL632]|nr:hypothetical protein BJ741DRAFT_630436 [Chytriomyces cf. hyalinus JEL632]
MEPPPRKGSLLPDQQAPGVGRVRLNSDASSEVGLRKRLDMERMCQEGAHAVLASLGGRDGTEPQADQCRKTIADSMARMRAIEAEISTIKSSAKSNLNPLQTNVPNPHPSHSPQPNQTHHPLSFSSDNLSFIPPMRSTSRSFSLPRPLAPKPTSLWNEPRKANSHDASPTPTQDRHAHMSYDSVSSADAQPHGPKMLRVASQKMGSAVDKVFTSFNRSLSLLSIRSSFTNLLNNGPSGSGGLGGSSATLNGPDMSMIHIALSDFDFLRCESPLSPEKVAYKLAQIETKLQIEEKVQAGTERMWEVMLKLPNSGAGGSNATSGANGSASLSAGSEKRAKGVEEKMLECRDKVAILKRSLARYQGLVVVEKDLPSLPIEVESDEPLTFETESSIPTPTKMSPRSRRNPVSGRLRVTLVGATALQYHHQIPNSNNPNAKAAHRPETFAILRVDGSEKTKTRASRSKWMDEVDVHVEKAGEVEIAIYEKGVSSSTSKNGIGSSVGGGTQSSGNGRVIALVWFTLYELETMLKSAAERKAEVGDKIGRSNSFGATAVEEQEMERRGSFPSIAGRGGSESAALSDGSKLSPIRSGLTPVAFDGENVWLELEPVGQLSMKVNFVADVEKVKKNIAEIVRSKPVQKVFQKKGHKFVATKFYPVMRCAVCTEFLVSSQGYQCQACKYTCHKKCQTKVPIKCITLTQAEQSADEQDDEQLLRHRIPHRFEEALTLGVTWCCHCGYMLPLSKRECKKCVECGISAHTNCSLLVPNMCGMTPSMMEQMRLAIDDAEKRKREKEIAAGEHARLLAVQELQMAEHARMQQQAFQQKMDVGLNSFIMSPVTASALPVYLPTSVVATPGTGTPLAATPTPQKRSKPRPVGLDDFTFLAVLGKGNFGKVMLAEEKTTGRHYAIKVLKKDFIIESDEVEATRSEKRVFLTANLERHPFLVNLHSCFQTESRLYFVMEFVSGGDLMWHIQQQQFTPERAKYYACEALLALEYFHKNNITYRDLKLDNILLTLDGHIKIADYGLCKENMPYGARTTTFCGTPEFMSPEILLEKPYTRAVDWWSFGVLIYELLLGQAPFKGDNEDEIFNSILHKDVAFPPKIDPKAADVIRRLLTKDPAHRLGSGPLDADEIKAHPYFADVNWTSVLRKEIPPPFVPSITSPTDVSNFDQEFTKEMPVLTPCKTTLAAADQEEFRGFTYVSEWAQAARGPSSSSSTTKPGGY